MFYDRLLQICVYHNMSPTAAAQGVGMTGAHVNRWKTGSTPNDLTVAKFSSFFGIPSRYFVGDDDEAYYYWTEYQLKDAERKYDESKDDRKRSELATSIDVLRESLYDQRIASKLGALEKKRKPADDGELEESLEILRSRPETRALLHASKGMTTEQVEKMAQFMETMRGGGNGQSN